MFGAGLIGWWLRTVCWLVGWPGGGSWLVVFLLPRVGVGLAVACRWSGERMTVGVGLRGFSLGLLGLLGTMVGLYAVVVVWFGFPQTMERLHGHRLVRHAIHVFCPDWRGCGCAGSAFRSWVDHGSSVCSQKNPWRVRVSPPRRDHRTRALRYVVDSLRWLGWCLGRPDCSSRRCSCFLSCSSISPIVVRRREKERTWFCRLVSGRRTVTFFFLSSDPPLFCHM